MAKRLWGCAHLIRPMYAGANMGHPSDFHGRLVQNWRERFSIPSDNGIICVRGTWAVGGLLTSSTQGARFMRKVVPSALFVLTLISSFLSKPLLATSRLSLGTAILLGLVCSLILISFIVWVAFIVDKGETDRRRIEEAQHLSAEQLDRLLDRIEEPAEGTGLMRKVTTGLTLALFLSGLLGLLSWRVTRQAEEESDWVARAQQVSAVLEGTLRHLLDVETGSRGYAETGSEPFLEPYRSGRLAVFQSLLQLRLLIADPAQAQRLPLLEARANSAIVAAQEIVADRQRGAGVPMVALFERGKSTMDDARNAIADMESSEERTLDQRTQRSRAARSFNSLVLFIGSLLNMIFLSIAGAMVKREIGISNRARSQLKAVNLDLERRVAERTETVRQGLATREEALRQLAEQKYALDQHALLP